MSLRARAPAKTQPDTLTVAAVSEFLGIPIPTIRSWERRYSFPTPRRTSGGHRRYTMHEVELLGAFRDEITAGRAPSKVAQGLKNRAEAQSRPEYRYVLPLVDGAQQMAHERVTSALNRAAHDLGIESMIQNVLLPAMREVGFRWQIGRCSVAHEHLATRAVREWIGLRTAASQRRSTKGTILLACGPRDLHTIALEAFALLLVRHGWKAVVLGARTPASLQQAIVSRSAQGVVIASHQSVNRRAAMQSIDSVARLSLPVFYAGNAFSTPASRRNVPGSYLGDNLIAAAVQVNDHFVAKH